MKITTNILDVIEVLRAGGVVVYPTETTYGIGCDATIKDAVEKIFRIKGRPQAKGVAAILPSTSWGEEFGLQWTRELRTLAEKHWPGPLAIALSVQEPHILVPDYFVDGTFAVRRSSHKDASALADAIGVPLMSTSANVSGEPVMYAAQEIYDRFLQEEVQPDIIFDVGILPERPPSTLVRWNAQNQRVEVLRQGGIVIA